MRPRPPEPYSTVLLVDEVAPGSSWAYESVAGGSISSLPLQPIRAYYSVQFYRKGARDLARAFRLWAHSALGILEAERLRLTFLRASVIRQIDSVRSEEWEERAALDMALEYVARLTEDTAQDVGVIIEADVTVNEELTVTIRGDQ